MKKFALTWFVISALSGCSVIYDERHVQWEQVKPESFPVFHAIGYASISKQLGKSDDEKLLMAIKASKIEAYRELTEQVYGHQLSASTTVEQMVAGSDKMKAKVQGIIKGAKVIKTYAVGDVYTTEMELDTELVYKLNKVQNPDKEIKRIRYY